MGGYLETAVEQLSSATNGLGYWLASTAFVASRLGASFNGSEAT
jgi:hypothetical protein